VPAAPIHAVTKPGKRLWGEGPLLLFMKERILQHMQRVVQLDKSERRRRMSATNRPSRRESPTTINGSSDGRFGSKRQSSSLQVLVSHSTREIEILYNNHPPSPAWVSCCSPPPPFTVRFIVFHLSHSCSTNHNDGFKVFQTTYSCTYRSAVILILRQ